MKLQFIDDVWYVVTDKGGYDADGETPLDAVMRLARGMEEALGEHEEPPQVITADVVPIRTGKLPCCPECKNNKHVNCDGTSWDEDKDVMGKCYCTEPGHVK